MKIAQAVEGIFEAMPMEERRRYLTEKMLKEYSKQQIHWVEALSNQSFCDIDFHLVYREYEQNLYRESEKDEMMTVTIAELTLVEDRIDFDNPETKEKP